GQSVRVKGPRSQRPQGHSGLNARLDRAATSYSRKPFRGPASERRDRARRARRRTGNPVATEVQSEKWPRTSGAALGGGGYWQIPLDGGTARARYSRTA